MTCDDLVECDKDHSLYKGGKEYIVEEQKSSHDDKSPLRYECEYGHKFAAWLIVQLIYHVPVDGVVVSVVLANEVIEICLVQELIAVDCVEVISQTDECPR